MELKDLKIGMAIRYGNQKYEGKVLYIREWAGDVQVQFEVVDEPERIEPMFLRPV
ncbi:MAG: hypothetical protein ACYDEF_01675 [Methanosarcina sp.]